MGTESLSEGVEMCDLKDFQEYGCTQRLQILDHKIRRLEELAGELEKTLEVLNVCTLELSKIARKHDANRLATRLNEIQIKLLEQKSRREQCHGKSSDQHHMLKKYARGSH
jgi:hypothetical protein